MEGRSPTVWRCQFNPAHRMARKNGYCFDCGAYTGWKDDGRKKEVE